MAKTCRKSETGSGAQRVDQHAGCALATLPGWTRRNDLVALRPAYGSNRHCAARTRRTGRAQAGGTAPRCLVQPRVHQCAAARTAAARPAAWSTATIFDEPSFGSRPESRTSRGSCPYKAQRLIGAAPAGFRRCSRSGSLAKFAAIPSDLPDWIASVFLLLLLFGKQIDYQLSV